MNLKQASFLKRPSTDLPNVDYPEVSKDYPHFNVLGPHKSRGRINHSTIFMLVLAALYALCWIF